MVETEGHPDSLKDRLLEEYKDKLIYDEDAEMRHFVADISMEVFAGWLRDGVIASAVKDVTNK